MSFNARNFLTVIAATIVVGTEFLVVGYAAGWALANLAGFTGTLAMGVHVFFVACSFVATIAFGIQAARVEPFRTKA